jgi:putative endonuclease
VHRLVWYERIVGALPSIRREKQLKKWNRAWKIRLLEASNPQWEDLYPELQV